jgi:hypothetical protein
MAANPKTRFYLASLAAFLISVLAWFALNQLRVHWYLDAIEGRRDNSPYWTVIRLQEILERPIFLLLLLLLVIAIYECGRWIASKLLN